VISLQKCALILDKPKVTPLHIVCLPCSPVASCAFPD